MLAKAEGLLLNREVEAEKGEEGDEEKEVKGTLRDGKGRLLEERAGLLDTMPL